MSPVEQLPDDPATETDVIIGRLIDAEATPADRRRFDDLAGADPGLWRMLAMRRIELDLLAEGIDDATATARRVELPHSQPPARSLAWRFAVSGWAAVLVLLVSWAMLTWSARVGEHSSGERLAGDNGAAAPALTPDEHLAEYLTAPFVIGEEAPLLLETVERPDGTVQLRVMRRFIEQIVIGRDVEVPVESDGVRLTKDPAELRTQPDAPDAPSREDG